MSSLTKIYHSILYTSQFFVSEKNIESFVSELPKILDKFRVQNVNTRMVIIDELDLYLKDLKDYQLKGDLNKIGIITRKFFFRWFILLGLLVNLTSWKRIIISLKNRSSDILDYGVIHLKTLFELGKISFSVSSIASFTPLLKLLINKTKFSKSNSLNLSVSSGIVSSLSLIPLNDGAFKEYLSIYPFSYGLDSLLNYLKNRNGIDLFRPGVYLPLALSGILNSYETNQQNLSSLLVKFIKFMNVDECESKIERSNRILINDSSITKVITEYHYVKLYGANENVKILLNYFPKKLIILTGSLLPLFLIRNYFFTNKEEVKEQKWLLLKSSIKASLKLSITIILTFITNSILKRTTSLNPRIIGLISGLWAFVYKSSSSSMAISSYLLRSGILAIKRESNLKYLDHGLMASGMGILGYLYGIEDAAGVKSIAPARIVKYLKLIFDE